MSTTGYDYQDARCRQCGCTDSMACYHNDLGPCWWEADQANEQGLLCSHCTLEDAGQVEPGSVLRYWQDERDQQQIQDSLLIPLRK